MSQKILKLGTGLSAIALAASVATAATGSFLASTSSGTIALVTGGVAIAAGILGAGGGLWLARKFSRTAMAEGEATESRIAADAAQIGEGLRMRRAIDNVVSAVMMVDRDFVVTYVNETTKTMLRTNADQFRKLWPDFDPEKIIGMCIDTFHKAPAHQRRMLADPSNLPHKAEITVGDIRFSLHVTAAYDSAGTYCGNTLEWADISEARARALKNAEYQLVFEAINKAQAFVEFDMTGKILTANDNLLKVVGWSREEVIGRHHSMFVDPDYRTSPEYAQFWQTLNAGEFIVGQHRRVGKGNREIWMQVSYNPVFDAAGKPFKVVKFATDITEQVVSQRLMQQTVDQTRDVVAATRNNDLTRRIPQDGKTGDILALTTGINGLIDSMSDVISAMAGSSAAINSAASEITAGTADLSRRTEQQASSLEETSASMEEIATIIRQNADNAQQANQLAISASSVASDGGVVVGRAVEAMSKIETSSRKISDIIGVIDEIAFQTNLLALNAAVEAARAGDAGRGFAVVATEVRSLAQRSSGAAKDIKALIVESSAQVSDGVQLVNKTGSTLAEIVESVKRVTDIVSDIASASKQQSTGVEEINKAVSEMDEMTQQNSALVEETAAACRLLLQQAEDMQERMAAFRIEDSEPAPRAAARAPARHAPRAVPPLRRSA